MKRAILVIGLTVLLGACNRESKDDARASSDAGQSVSWVVTGDLEEACSCSVPCPCWFKEVPTRKTCDGTQAVFIRKGRYGDTRLDGLAVVQFVQSPEGKSMYESFGSWNIDHIYIDERADESQRAALRVLAAHFFPPAGRERKFTYTEITRTIEGDEHAVVVKGIGSFSGHLIEGGYDGAPWIRNPPMADPTHKKYLQGQATALAYRDEGQGWSYEKTNYMRNSFRVDDEEYARYQAAMAKKTAGN